MEDVGMHEHLQEESKHNLKKSIKASVSPEILETSPSSLTIIRRLIEREFHASFTYCPEGGMQKIVKLLYWETEKIPIRSVKVVSNSISILENKDVSKLVTNLQ